MQAQGGIPQYWGVHARHADIDRHCLHVQAVFGYRPGPAPEEVVAPRGAIPADNVDFGILLSESARKIVQQIEQMRVEMVNRACPVVPEKEFQLLDGPWKILIAATVNQIQPLVGMSVIEPETKGRRARWRVQAVGG